MTKKKRKLKKKSKIGISGVIVLLLIAVGIGVYYNMTQNTEALKEEKKETDKSNPSKINIVDTSSKSRPFAVMVNNHSVARKNHAGLQDAYIIYELIVEGGITRFLALYKDQDTAKIGSVRSARHYYLDYAMESDAYYVHWGQSPQAQSDIKSLKINAINGIAYEGKYFFRDKTLGVASEHTGFTSMELLNNAVSNLKLRSETNKDLLLNYSVKEIDLSNKDGAKEASKVSIRYSNSLESAYEYDKTLKLYKRIVNGVAHTDGVTGKQYTFKNIITYQVSNSLMVGDDKGRQDFDNIGNGSGYYITNGYAIPITWSKSSREAQTIYKFEDGKVLDVNDGNTFIQIQPVGQNLSIS